MKGPSQTLARKIMNAFRRDGWASLPNVVKPRTVARSVLGAGMERTEPCVTEGDLVRSRAGRQPAGGTTAQGNAKFGGAFEESERLIVALTPGESREQQRGRSRDGVSRDVCASDQRRTE